jgi:hypothetical protein
MPSGPMNVPTAMMPASEPDYVRSVAVGVVRFGSTRIVKHSPARRGFRRGGGPCRRSQTMRVTASREDSEDTKRVVRVPPGARRPPDRLSLITPQRGARFRPGRTSKIAFAAPKH